MPTHHQLRRRVVAVGLRGAVGQTYTPIIGVPSVHTGKDTRQDIINTFDIRRVNGTNGCSIVKVMEMMSGTVGIKKYLDVDTAVDLCCCFGVNGNYQIYRLQQYMMTALLSVLLVVGSLDYWTGSPLLTTTTMSPWWSMALDPRAHVMRFGVYCCIRVFCCLCLRKRT